MSYKVLIFKPNNSEKSNLILWKAQINPPKNYNSIATVLISDNIAVNNRRTEEEWEKLLTENGFKFELNYDSPYAKQYIIFDVNCVCFEFEIFACDVQAAGYQVEVAQDFILPILCALDLSKSGNIFPLALMSRIKLVTENLINNDDIGYDNVCKYMNQINKLSEHCQLFEVDVKYEIDER